MKYKSVRDRCCRNEECQDHGKFGKGNIIRHSMYKTRQGRRPKTVDSENRWFKKKQRQRIEGSFGNGKEHYRLDRVRHTIKNGSEIWIRSGILAMNLKAAINQA